VLAALIRARAVALRQLRLHRRQHVLRDRVARCRQPRQ
jgi:hypothetical protein